MTSSDVGRLSEPFWTAGRERRLVVPQCHACGRRFFTPSVSCPHCLASDWSWVSSPGRGAIYSFTTVYRSARGQPADRPPYTLVVVDLDDGWSMLSRLASRCDFARMTIGGRVHVEFEDLPTRTSVPVFALDDGGEPNG